MSASEEHEHEQAEAAYREQLEQHNLMKEQGLDAWADAMTEPIENEDRRILAREGIKSMFRTLLNGPPSPPMSFPAPVFLPGPVPNMPPEPPERVYRFSGEAWGDETKVAEVLVDFLCLAAGSTHTIHYTSGDVELFKGEESVILLTGEAAAAYLGWQEKQIASMRGMPIIGRF
jgi:hypothetical protein